MKSLAARIVVLAVVVALASTVVTILVVLGGTGSQNEAQARTDATREAEQLAAIVVQVRSGGLVPDGSDLLGAKAFQQVMARHGATSVIARPVNGFAVPAPFTPKDVTAVQSGSSATVRRDEGAQSWVVSGAAAGRVVVLVAEPIAPVRRLTAATRRQLVLMGGLGLLGGALAGLVLARGVTRPLARVADAARRLTAGERDVRVPVDGPTEVGDVAMALDALSGALEHSEQRQRQFLLAVSHELRTPLTSVSGWAEAMADGALAPQDVAGAAAIVRDEAARLQRRVEDLLALARLEADDFRLESGPVDLAALLWAAADAFAPRAGAGGVQLRVEAPASGPVITTDGERLRQVVDALADNALRVLPSGAPLVFSCSAAGDGWVRVEVRDGGPGLPPQDLAVAFERGVLTERYRGARAVGSGLGLALVGELARRLGGHAEARPAPEGGVAFAVVLPVR